MSRCTKPGPWGQGCSSLRLPSLVLGLSRVLGCLEQGLACPWTPTTAGALLTSCASVCYSPSLKCCQCDCGPETSPLIRNVIVKTFLPPCGPEPAHVCHSVLVLTGPGTGMTWVRLDIRWLVQRKPWERVPSMLQVEEAGLGRVLSSLCCPSAPVPCLWTVGGGCDPSLMEMPYIEGVSVPLV